MVLDAFQPPHWSLWFSILPISLCIQWRFRQWASASSQTPLPEDASCASDSLPWLHDSFRVTTVHLEGSELSQAVELFRHWLLSIYPKDGIMESI